MTYRRPTWGAFLVVLVTAWMLPRHVGAVTSDELINANTPAATLSEISTSNAVRGQLLIKLHATKDLSRQQQAVTTCAVCVRRFNRALRGYTSDQSSSLDTLISKYHAVFRAALFRQEVPGAMGPETVAQLQADENAWVADVKRRYPKRTVRATPGAVTSRA